MMVSNCWSNGGVNLRWLPVSCRANTAAAGQPPAVAIQRNWRRDFYHPLLAPSPADMDKGAAKKVACEQEAAAGVADCVKAAVEWQLPHGVD